MTGKEVIHALVEIALPDDGESFNRPDRRRFFEALQVNLDVIYGPVGLFVTPVERDVR